MQTEETSKKHVVSSVFYLSRRKKGLNGFSFLKVTPPIRLSGFRKRYPVPISISPRKKVRWRRSTPLGLYSRFGGKAVGNSRAVSRHDSSRHLSDLPGFHTFRRDWLTWDAFFPLWAPPPAQAVRSFFGSLRSPDLSRQVGSPPAGVAN